MPPVAVIIAAAAAILPADRMSMADRLFDRGMYAEALEEYSSLEGSAGIAGEDILYRLAECQNALGNKEKARELYGRLLKEYPLSARAPRARLMSALASAGDERARLLKSLDADSVPGPVRAVALYHLGADSGDAAMLARSVELDPKGPCAPYAKYRKAVILSAAKEPADRKKAIADFIEIYHSGAKDLAESALFLAAQCCYSEKRYGNVVSVCSAYEKAYPQSPRLGKVRLLAAWSCHAQGRYAEAEALCGEGSTDDSAYLLASCALATGRKDLAATLMRRYLEKFPDGAHRKAVELPLARMDFEAAEKAKDFPKAVDAARRAFSVSGEASDAMRLAWAFESGGNDAEAEAGYADVAAKFPGTREAAEAQFRRAMSAIRAKQWSKAELLLAETLSLQDGTRQAEALYWRGVSAVMLGHGSEGAAHLSKALEKGISIDQTREAKLMLADIALEAGRRDEAAAAYIELAGQGACARMGAAKLRSVGMFLLSQGGDEAAGAAEKCAEDMLASGPPEWMQSGYALKGRAEESRGGFTAATEAYRLAAAQKANTEDLKSAVLNLGVLESRAGSHLEAERLLKQAVELNAEDRRNRAKAYLWLAKNCESMTDWRGACAYATVIVTLFDGEQDLADEAEAIIKRHPEAVK